MSVNMKPGDKSDTDLLHEKDGYRVVVIGMTLVIITFAVAVWKWSTAADVATAVGSVTGVIGTLAGTFFGIQAGSSGKDKADKERKTADADRTQARVQAAVYHALSTDPQRAQVLKILKEFTDSTVTSS